MPSRPTRSLLARLAGAGVAALCSLGLIAAAPAPPPARALLIGVGDYPALPESLRLAAPPRDVERLRAALVGAGLDPSGVQAMTERSGERPTRAAILAALRKLAEEARPGQQVLVYFSGHGAQAPARHAAEEPDGLEELYLAADAARWDGGRHAVPGSIADFEMEAALQAIRATGAEVWFVADACHAAGLTRGAAGAGARAKAVSAADLDIPLSASALRSRSSEAAPLAPGGFAGFYAAAPGALALERALPAGAADAEPASVFTFALVRALNQGRFRSLRDLALAVAASDIATGPGAPAPVFEGGLNGSMLGLEPRRRRFRVLREDGRLVVQAGAPEGFTPTARVRLYGPSGPYRSLLMVSTAGLAEAELDTNPGLEGPLWAEVEQPAPAPRGVGRGGLLLAVLAPFAGAERSRRLEVEARLWRRGCTANPPARLGFPQGSEPIELMAAPVLRHCDVVYLRVSNAASDPVDVSPLYVDAAGDIVGLALAPDDDVRLQPGEARYMAFRVVTRDGAGRALSQGIERLVLVSAPAGAVKFDLRGLAGGSNVRGFGGAPALDPPGVAAMIVPVRIQDPAD